MNREVIITCALTGAGDTVSKSPHVPVTPKDIAADAINAAAAGASVVHIHVRDPRTGAPSRDPSLFEEVHNRIREQNQELILNYTGGMGGDLWFDLGESATLAAHSDFVCAAERVQHVTMLRPDIGSMDCGSINFGEMVYATTPSLLRSIATLYRDHGVKAELEVFELGHIEIAKILIGEGLLPGPLLFQLCLGVSHGAPATPAAMMAMRNALPQDVVWAAFGVGRMQFPMLAQAVLLGGHVRVGLEDNLYLERGVLASNESMVQKAVRVIEDLGAKVATVQRARQLLQLEEVPSS